MFVVRKQSAIDEMLKKRTVCFVANRDLSNSAKNLASR